MLSSPAFPTRAEKLILFPSQPVDGTSRRQFDVAIAEHRVPADVASQAASAGNPHRQEAVASDDAGDPNRARTVRLAERPGRRPEVTVTQPAARVENNDEDDLLEIPAFLRRQAN